jgi:hypothetical protein
MCKVLRVRNERLNIFYIADGRVENKKERDEGKWQKSSSEAETPERFKCKTINYFIYGMYDFQSSSR